MPEALSYDVIVIGAGAAGMMCAIEAGKRGRRTAVLEHSNQIGRKIAISGGGRCNFTNLRCGPENFLCSNPHFPKSALARYRPADFIALVEKHRIAYHEKKLGQLFCDASSSQIIRMLQAEAEAAGVTIELGQQVREVSNTGGFVVEAARASFRAPALVVATGGLSIPKIGATDLGYRIARRFGLKVKECRPALVPFTFSPAGARAWAGMAGVSTEIIASGGKQRFQEKMLFTHAGLSGPAILQISSYWKPGGEISIDLLPGIDLASDLLARKAAGERITTKNILGRYLPNRLADRWFELHPPARPVAEASIAELSALAKALHCWRVRPGGTEGYDKAEVTAGGIDVDELSSKTFEARRVPGLYFIGEALDVTGQLGGFNFQWAWASGFAAGQAV